MLNKKDNDRSNALNVKKTLQHPRNKIKQKTIEFNTETLAEVDS